MTRTEIMEFWSMAQQFAGHMRRIGCPDHEIEQFLRKTDTYCGEMLRIIDEVARW